MACRICSAPAKSGEHRVPLEQVQGRPLLMQPAQLLNEALALAGQLKVLLRHGISHGRFVRVSQRKQGRVAAALHCGIAQLSSVSGSRVVEWQRLG